jgi:hypothetical protein
MNDEQVRNFKWVSSHYEELTKRFNNRWIAVLDEKVIESDDSATSLKMKLDRKYKEDKERLKSVVLDFITDKKFPDLDM